MKLNPVVFALALSALSTTGALAAPADSFQLKTVDGANVQISADEIKTAYGAYLKAGPHGSGAQQFLVNDDGSVTIVEPRFTYAGAQMPFGNASYADSGVSANVAQGAICQFYGLDYSIWAETEPTKEKVVLLNFDNSGKPVFAGAPKYEKSGYAYKSVTCVKHPNGM